MTSKETRWFFDNNKLKSIEEWFANLPAPQKFGDTDLYPRQDYYLYMPGVKNLGIKIREPKKDPDSGKLKTALEVKQQISDNEPIELGNDNKGFSNEWQKFSYEMIEGAGNLLTINPSIPLTDKNWVRVDKNRIMVKYNPESKSICEGTILLNEACGIELTKIKVSGKTYYSFGLEAYSISGKRLDDNFMECCNLIFTLIDIKGWELKSSLSYPEFLTSVFSEGLAAVPAL